ncbi:uncharacterized protein [Penaeus vannamei]|uniref:uncharacterized protein n=1 Tax=Penaeus vannamei TaxID=6689 RepID=UPI00387FAD19
MKAAILLCFAAVVAVAAGKPKVRGTAPPTSQNPEMIPAFINASEEGQDAHRKTPAQGFAPSSRAGPPAISFNSPPSPSNQDMYASYLPAPQEVQALSAFHTMHASSARAGPPTSSFGSPPSPHNPGMMSAFIPTPEDIQALHALHTMHAPGVVPNVRAGPPSMPPAVAQLIATYRGAGGVFAPQNRFA